MNTLLSYLRALPGPDPRRYVRVCLQHLLQLNEDPIQDTLSCPCGHRVAWFGVWDTRGKELIWQSPQDERTNYYVRKVVTAYTLRATFLQRAREEETTRAGAAR